MKKLEVRFTRAPGDWLPVGTLAEDRGRTYFQYAPDFPATGLNLSPFRLPFEAGMYEHTDLDFGPLPGRPHMLRLAAQADIAKPQANAIIGEVQTALARWPRLASQAGVSESLARQIAAAFPKAT